MSAERGSSFSSDNQSYDVMDNTNMCLELALEGERLCKGGDCRAGVAFFHAALQAGTEDLRTLTAIYSQMGNAYFYLGDYTRAIEYHDKDLKLARTLGDRLGEAKSSGNLGNALKVTGRFDEAVNCCKLHLDISRELNDTLSEGRALYNLGNVYHAKGKHFGKKEPQEPGRVTEEVKQCLEEAVKYYEENLTLMRKLSDLSAQGRACGNLGNANYLLGNFEDAAKYHKERLQIARIFHDVAAERRAHSNLGNCHIFLREFEKAAEHYKETLRLAQVLEEKAVEAQACYSLGNTYTLLNNYAAAIEYHLKHYHIAQELKDREGEARACWSLGYVYSSAGDLSKSLRFAEEQMVITRELEDVDGNAAARANILELSRFIETFDSNANAADSGKNKVELKEVVSSSAEKSTENSAVVYRYRVRRESMDQLDLMKLTPGKKQELPIAPLPITSKSTSDGKINEAKAAKDFQANEKEDFFDTVWRMQSRRMDDQRFEILPAKPGTPAEVDYDVLRMSNMPDEQKKGKDTHATPDDEFLDLISRMQSTRMNDQRAAFKGRRGGT